MKNCIQIKKKHLIFRGDARRLYRLIRKKLEKNSSKTIFLDFSYVNFLSRSFIDEFLNSVNELEGEGIKIKPVCLKAALWEFITRVKKTRSKIQEALP